MKNGTRLLLTTGPGLEQTPHGNILVVDWERKRIVDKYRYTHGVHERSQKGLAGAAWHNGGLLVATECELVEFTLCPLAVKQVRSFSFLNDVHHVVPYRNRIWVCNTGLDCVEELNAEWTPVNTHDLLGPVGRRIGYAMSSIRESLRTRYHTIRGWRKPYDHLSDRPLLPNTQKLLRRNAFRHKDRELRFSLFRPHIVHPNHLLSVNGEIWVTLSFSGQIVSLKDGRIVASGLGRVHDGIVADNEHYVTDADTNRLIVHEFDPNGPALVRRLMEKTITGQICEGFLRGVAVIGDRVFVGLTARRSAPDRWSRACVLALSRGSLKVLDEWVIPEEFGKMVFSILDATDVYD